MSDSIISRDQAAAVAHLARLALTEEELAAMTGQLNAILEYVAALKAIDTGGVPATFQILPLVNVFREDCVAPGLPVEAVLSNAPARVGDYFREPRILDLES